MIEGRYVVVETVAGWMIEYNNDESGPYKSMAEAMLCAIDAAIEVGRSGINTEVCLIGAGGRLRSEWSYCRYKRPSAPTASVALPLTECAAVVSDAVALRQSGRGLVSRPEL